MVEASNGHDSEEKVEPKEGKGEVRQERKVDGEAATLVAVEGVAQGKEAPDRRRGSRGRCGSGDDGERWDAARVRWHLAKAWPWRPAVPWSCGQTSSRGRGVVGLRGLAPLSFSADGGTSEGEEEIERREWWRKGGEQGAG